MKKRTLILMAAFTLAISSCNNSADKDKKNDDTTAAQTADSTATAVTRTPFTKEVTYDKYKFTVTTAGEGDDHHFMLIPSGLTVSNDTMHEDVKGTLKDVIINDIDGDNSPEIGVIDVTPEGAAHLHVFSTFNGKSIGQTHMPELAADDKALIGYKGGDEYEFVENTLVRKFPIYEGDTKTSKVRQLQYKLKPGEAMKQLVLDKTVDF